LTDRDEIEPLRMVKLNPDFKFEVAQTIDGKTVLKCFQCGICSSSCPISDSLDVKPHQVIQMVHLGARDIVLRSETIWICSTCFACNDRCPQGVEVGNVMFSLKNIAVRELGIPAGLKRLGQILLQNGRTVEIGDYENNERKEVGLPPAPRVDVDALKEIWSKTSLNRLLER